MTCLAEQQLAREETPRIVGMRDAYFEALYPAFAADERCVFLSADNGAPSMDRFAKLPGRFRQVGISECHMAAHACGLALEGHRVVCYSIAAFLLRALDSIKVNMCAQRERGLPITWVAVGSGFAYDVMGPTHHATGVFSSLRWLPNLTVWQPADAVTARALAERGIADGPEVILLDRAGIGEDQYSYPTPVCQDGFGLLGGGRDVVILSTGIMSHQAMKVRRLLWQDNIHASVVDVCRLKPLPEWHILALCGKSPVVTLEEDYLAGGLGSSVAEAFADRGVKTPLLRIGLPSEFSREMGGREVLWRKHGLDAESVARKIKEKLGCVNGSPRCSRA